MNLFFSILLLISALFICAQSIQVDQAYTRYKIIKAATTHIDHSGKLKIKDIQKLPFKYRSPETLSLTPKKAAVWLKLEVHNQTNEYRRLIKELSIFNQIKLYQQHSTDSFELSFIDEKLPYNTKEILHPVDQFNLNIALGNSKICYLRLTTNEVLKVNFFIASVND